MVWQYRGVKIEGKIELLHSENPAYFIASNSSPLTDRKRGVPSFYVVF